MWYRVLLLEVFEDDSRVEDLEVSLTVAVLVRSGVGGTGVMDDENGDFDARIDGA